MKSKKYKSSMDAGNYDPNIDGINSVLEYINFIEDSVNTFLQGLKVYSRTDIPQGDDIKFKMDVDVINDEIHIDKTYKVYIIGRIIYKKGLKEYVLSPLTRLQYEFKGEINKEVLRKALVQFNSTLIRFLKYGKNDLNIDNIFAGNSKLDLYHFDKEYNKTFNEEIGYKQNGN